MEEIKKYVQALIEAGIEIRKLEKEVEKNRDMKKKLEKDIKSVKDQKVKPNYIHLMKNLNNYLNQVYISSIPVEEFIGPNGICQAIARGLTFRRTQLRKFFNEVKFIKIKLNSSSDEEVLKSIKLRLVTLVPKLAYSHGKNLIDENFYEFMKLLITKLKDDFTPENFEKFEQIFEAIIAYHVYYNPKEE